MNKCIHDVYIPSRMGNLGISDVCSICMSVCPSLDRRYGIVYQDNILHNVQSVYAEWLSDPSEGNSGDLYTELYRAAAKIANAIFVKVDVGDMEDAIQDSATHVWEATLQKRFENKSKYSTWANAALRNYLKNWRRKSSFFVASIDDPDLEITPSQEIDETQCQDKEVILDEKFAHLSDRERLLLEQRLYGFSMKEISEALGISLRTVSSLWASVKEQFRG